MDERSHDREGATMRTKMRPLTSTRELLLIASAFGVGGMLQALVILYISAFLQSELSSFVVAMVSR